ncbi:glycosyltransferase family 4 protein [Alteribacter natronophilus]|uniref:glycosyltransferase family 4 protein n=1 Tax=Alteribacter natronophilus TaxID=2583810 RepID=UPI00110D3804|nr:glycosyltransferase family 4 protein [Alteribacter natronophilus]TMW70553.1 glycosyltransferase family 4 protein [Alteribacter natronophilus]
MQKKILLCATVDYHFKAFHLPYMKWFKEQGWEVHVAASGTMKLPYTDVKYDIPIQRSPFRLANLGALRELRAIVDREQFAIVHSHTPLGGVIGRLAARRARKNGTKTFYTAHGFHFCKGAPAANWLCYYPVEKLLANLTDCLVTINEEDYERARMHRLSAGTIAHVHGVGVDTEKYRPADEYERCEIRKELGYSESDLLLFYAAEFNKNKNQQFLIHSLALLKDELPGARLLLAGEGALEKECRALAGKLGVSDRVDFLGFRKDIVRILPACDIAVGSSFREGLPVNIMEAMSCGLPVLATENRGHCELIKQGVNGWTVPPDNHQAFAEKLTLLTRDEKLRRTLGEHSRARMMERYSLNLVLNENKQLYRKYMNEMEEAVWAIQ